MTWSGRIGFALAPMASGQSKRDELAIFEAIDRDFARRRFRD